MRETLAPRSRASFRLGRERFEGRLRHQDGIALGTERLLAIAERELATTQERFREVARRVDARAEPAEVWQRVKTRHPAPGQLVQAVRDQLGDLVTFLERNDLVTLPDDEPPVVAPTPDFYRWTFASVWTPGPFEPKPLPSYYYVTDVDPSWSVRRAEEHLRDLSFATLWSVSVHEAYPGHYLHFRHQRKIARALRKSTLFAPVSFIEGWAHYCEQMMMEAGLGRDDDTLELGQIAEALLRLVRMVVGIKLHTEDLSVEQGVRLFREQAYLEEGSARREAERGTFDPGYVLYAAGRLMLLKLRDDLQAREGSKFSLKSFHDRLLGQGSLPLCCTARCCSATPATNYSIDALFSDQLPSAFAPRALARVTCHSTSISATPAGIASSTSRSSRIRCSPSVRSATAHSTSWSPRPRFSSRALAGM